MKNIITNPLTATPTTGITVYDKATKAEIGEIAIDMEIIAANRKIENNTLKITAKALEVIEGYRKILSGEIVATLGREQRMVLEKFLTQNPIDMIGAVLRVFEDKDELENAEITQKVNNQLGAFKFGEANTKRNYILRKYFAKQVISFCKYSNIINEYTETKIDGDKMRDQITYRLAKDLLRLPTRPKLFDTEPVDGETKAKRTIYSKGKRIAGEAKEFMDVYGKQEVKLVELSEAALIAIVKNRKDYTEESKYEIEALKLRRYTEYVKQTRKAYGKKMYHHLALEHRGRARKIRNLNPITNWFGEETENAMWELYNAEALTLDGYEDLIWQAVILTVKKHASFKQAQKMYKAQKDAIHKELEEGEDASLYTQRMSALLNEGIGASTAYLSGVDATNGGQSHMGFSFMSKEFLQSSNFGGLLTPQDSHQEITNTFNALYGVEAPRKYVKKKNQEKEHGSSTKSVTSRGVVPEEEGKDLYHVGLNEIYAFYGSTIKLTEKQVDEVFSNKLGVCYSNINKIADYGEVLVRMGNMQVNWRMPDSFIAVHQAYTSGEEQKVTAVTPDGRIESVVVIGDYPIDLTAGKIEKITHMITTYDNNGKEIVKNRASNKVRGLLANITHSVDGFVARQTILRANKEGFVVLYKHDKFFTHPNNTKKFREIYGEVMLEQAGQDLFGQALANIEKATGVKAPTLIYGNVTVKGMLVEDYGRQPYLVG